MKSKKCALVSQPHLKVPFRGKKHILMLTSRISFGIAATCEFRFLSGLLLFHIPFVEYSGEDYSNSHDAVGLTASLQSPTSTFYYWYGEITPDENEVAQLKTTYKAYLKR